MSRSLVLVLAALLLVPALAEAQSDRGPSAPSDRRSPTAPTSTTEGRGGDEPGGSRGQGPPDGRGPRGNQSDRPGPGVGIGAFAVAQASRAVNGDFVTFEYRPTSVRNVSADGLLLFDVLVTGDATSPDAGRRPAVGVQSRGSVVGIDTAAYRVRAHDTPNALFGFESDGGFRLEFPDGTTLRLAGKHVEVLYPDGRTGRVFGDGLAIVGGDVVGDERATFMLDAKRGAFDVHRKDIGRAIATRAVGAEVTLARPEQADGPVREEVMTFGNVTVQTHAKKGNVTLIVEGHGFDGRVIVLNVDPELFGLSQSPQFQVLFDGAPIVSADGIADVLDPDDDGLQPEYILAQHGDGLQLIVSVPHYSVHTLSLVEMIEEVPPRLVAGFVGAIIVVAAGGVVLFRRPRG